MPKWILQKNQANRPGFLICTGGDCIVEPNDFFNFSLPTIMSMK